MTDKPLGVSQSRTMWRQIRGLSSTGRLRLAGHSPRTLAGFGVARLVNAAEAMKAALEEAPAFEAAIEAFENEGGPCRPDGSPQPDHSYLVEEGRRLKRLSTYVRT